jgi:chromosome segregation ATPase
VTEINEFSRQQGHLNDPELPPGRALMTEVEKPIVSLHQRLDTLRQAFDRELASFVAEFDELKAVAERAKTAESGQDKRLRQLEERAEGQSELIATLTQEAQEARALRAEVRARDLDIEKLTAEIGSRNELIQLLRQQLGEFEGIKTTSKQRDKKIFEQQHELERKQQEIERAEREIDSLRRELAAAQDNPRDEPSVDTAEFIALKAELDARKSMIRSLRADADRAEDLAAQVEAKRETITVLEESIDQHVKTIAELRRSTDVWKQKYQTAKGRAGVDPNQTLVEEPAFTDGQIEALEALDKLHQGQPERTLAIDMSDALTEARRQKSLSKTPA